MEIVFDSAKDASNIAKHGVSLARAADLSDAVVIEDNRFTERRFRIYGLLDGVPHCAAVTLRAGKVRVISFRRAHTKEYRRHV